MKIEILTLLIIILSTLKVCEYDKEYLWKDSYEKILLESQLINEILTTINEFSLFDFDKNGIPELIIYGIGQNEEDKVVIIGYEKDKSQIAYLKECYYVDMYYDVDTNELVLYYPNSQGNPVSKYRYINSQFKISFHAYADNKYVITEYEENGTSNTYSMSSNYGDTFEIVADACKEFNYYKPTQENIINSFENWEE